MTSPTCVPRSPAMTVTAQRRSAVRDLRRARRMADGHRRRGRHRGRAQRPGRRQPARRRRLGRRRAGGHRRSPAAPCARRRSPRPATSATCAAPSTRSASRRRCCARSTWTRTACAGGTPRTCSPTCCPTAARRCSTATSTTTAESVEQFAAGDGERWRRAYAEWRGVSAALLERAVRPRSRRSAAGSALPARRRVGRRAAAGPPLRAAGPRARRGDCSPARARRLLLAGCALHTDLAPDEAGSGVYGWLLAMLGQQYRLPGAGRRGAADHRRAGRPAADRGRPDRRTTPPVDAGARRRAAGRWASGTADGVDWRARRAVLADVPAPALYLDLVGRRCLPPRLVDGPGRISGGTAPRSRSTGRCPARCRGRTRPPPAPAPCTSAPTSTG